MKNFMFLAFMFLLITSHLNAYSKKIVFCAFSQESSAKESLEEFKKSSDYKEFNEIAVVNKIELFYKKSGKYFVIVAEPIFDLRVGIKAFNLVKKRYKSAYTMSYTPPVVVKKKEELKEVETIKVKEPLQVAEPKRVIKKYLEKNSTLEQNLEDSVRIEIEKNDTIVENKAVKKSLPLTIKDEPLELVKEKKELIDVWAVIRYTITFFFLFVGTFYYFKFKRLYDEY